MKEHIKTFKKFINEQVQEKITVTFKELYMKNEVKDLFQLSFVALYRKRDSRVR